MIHPITCLRRINDIIGSGVFATAFIPKGTITYAKDSLEIEVSPERYQTMDRHARAVVEKYSYIDPSGTRIVSWDLAKYVNHRCDFNTISTGYGFEIAIRDIQPDEELTDEYGIFNLESAFQCGCGSDNCRGTVRPDDWSTHGLRWDALVRDTLQDLQLVEQPLWSLLDPRVRRATNQYLQTGLRYRPVQRLQYFPQLQSLQAS
ncbi:MAG: SET domain-containing protein-lysine N-methyltransferase [Verrucomicrobia bacterium]|nr:SET domain-containing protein-lysine N-methyltransferase [Verrucomicrobiota bacterium]MDA1007316.1 SET domain-containing protein-lysine N-methyltransferase [Verrucomicrobiota bacterium]